MVTKLLMTEFVIQCTPLSSMHISHYQCVPISSHLPICLPLISSFTSYSPSSFIFSIYALWFEILLTPYINLSLLWTLFYKVISFDYHCIVVLLFVCVFVFFLSKLHCSTIYGNLLAIECFSWPWFLLSWILFP